MLLDGKMHPRNPRWENSDLSKARLVPFSNEGQGATDLQTATQRDS